MSEPDLRRLDDPEPPLATEDRLDAVLNRGRKLRRRRTAMTTGAAMVAVVVVVALAGAVGLVRAHIGPVAGVPAAGRPVQPTAPPSTTAADTSPPAAGAKVSQVLTTGGVGPYLIGLSSKSLQARGYLPMKPPNPKCPDTYAPTESSQLDPATLRIIVQPPGYVALVEASGREYVTPSGAYIGMPQTRLAEIYGGQLLPVSNVPEMQTYTVGTAGVVGFVVADGQVTYLMAGSKSTVVAKLKSGIFAGC